MKLTAFTDYSLRVLMYLAANSGRKSTIAEIATAFGISEHHLVKVVHFLGRQGWIATIRGKGGGMTLAMQPGDIRLGQVVRDTEGSAVPAECFEAGGGHCIVSGCCGLQDVLAQAVQAFHGVLDRYTLADVMANRPALVQALEFHRSLPESTVPVT
ncbi:RrF2 family transcriptional regulator [Azohydromonas caseinilytica]|uniref:Rrf2 family transcriptional regulator n=1 Tax=Azohydromonas caseinilytica TaxID=2728836 RepID=A0A848FAS6_9BURK|nr:Rrf2 family transcriptional regulator [Azohydromonas caseinilytica]NML17297.1 Rrf2 family transcriptional regulator [Azohydromonas caseinilytica]